MTTDVVLDPTAGPLLVPAAGAVEETAAFDVTMGCVVTAAAVLDCAGTTLVVLDLGLVAGELDCAGATVAELDCTGAAGDEVDCAGAAGEELDCTGATFAELDCGEAGLVELDCATTTLEELVTIGATDAEPAELDALVVTATLDGVGELAGCVVCTGELETAGAGLDETGADGEAAAELRTSEVVGEGPAEVWPSEDASWGVVVWPGVPGSVVVISAGGVVEMSEGAGVEDGTLDDVSVATSSEGFGSFKGTGQAVGAIPPKVTT